MDIDHLKCFILVAENLSFARAAEALYISQPAVTKQISVLEQELGTTLFLRSTRHVELTAAGMAFYRDAKDIVAKTQMAVERVRQRGGAGGSLRIGLSSAAALQSVTPVLTRFHQRCPDVCPDVEVLSFKTILNLFLEDKLDLLFYYRENMPARSDAAFRLIREEPLVCLMPAEHPLAGRESIAGGELKGEAIVACNPLNAPRVIAEAQKKLLEDCGTQRVCYCSGVETAHCFVAAGLGVAILPEGLAVTDGGLVSVPLEGRRQLSFGVFSHKRGQNDLVRQFLSCL